MVSIIIIFLIFIWAVLVLNCCSHFLLVKNSLEGKMFYYGLFQCISWVLLECSYYFVKRKHAREDASEFGQRGFSDSVCQVYLRK